MFDTKQEQHYPDDLDYHVDSYGIWLQDAIGFCLKKFDKFIKLQWLYLMAQEYVRLDEKPSNPDLTFFADELDYLDDEVNNNFINEIRKIMGFPTSPYEE